MGTKTKNLKTHFADEFGAVSLNAATAVPSGRLSEHYIFAFGLGLVPLLQLCLTVSLVWVTRLPLEGSPHTIFWSFDGRRSI